MAGCLPREPSLCGLLFALRQLRDAPLDSLNALGDRGAADAFHPSQLGTAARGQLLKAPTEKGKGVCISIETFDDFDEAAAQYDLDPGS